MSKAAELANLIGNINAGGGGVNRNVIINGNMSVAQRRSPDTGVGDADGYFTCDRWKFAQATNAGRFTQSQDSSAPSGFANSLKLACTTTDTSIGADEAALIQQLIEGQNLQAFAKGTSDAKPFAVSFYVKGNASATYTAELFDNDNSRSNGQTFNVTTDWTRVELTYPADTTGAFDNDVNASLYFNIWLHAGSTYTGGTFTNGTWTAVSNANVRVGDGTSFFDSTDRTLFITGVQIEVGQNPTEFEHEPFERTLAKCQRYLVTLDMTTNLTGDTYGKFFVGPIISSTIGRPQLNFPVHMRGKPSLVTSSASTLALNHGSNSNTALSSLSLNQHSNIHTGTIEASVSSGLSAGDSCCLSSNNNQTSFVRFDAEL